MSKPIVMEKLDFTKKKKQIIQSPKTKRNRQISAFAYSKITEIIESQAFKNNISVTKVNPAYTSIIGRVKYSRMYNISIHRAAALVIVRRLFNFSERIPNYLNNIPDNKGKHISLPELVKNPNKHIWSP